MGEGMSFLEILYSIFIRPLELIYDFLFYNFFMKIENVGICIIILSLIVNILILPLYHRADKIQAEENEKKKSLKGWEDHIKKNFKGDERFMMLQTYYRQNGYKPYQSLKTAMPLFLEIPFFIAAFHFLSNLPLLNGVDFGPIKDLSKPDALLSMGGVTINILPILMTVINLISGTVYNRSVTFKDRLQTYIMALVFLVLLYKSPAGLTFYWTLNNVFSLIKNIVYRIIDKRVKKESKEKKTYEKKGSLPVFIFSAFILAFLTGFYIPTTVVGSSVQEFISISTLENPVHFILISVATAIGLFVVWFGIFYFLAGDRFKGIIANVVFVFSVLGLFNYFTSDNTSQISKSLMYVNEQKFTMLQHVQSFVILAATIVLCTFIFIKRKAQVHQSLRHNSRQIMCQCTIFNRFKKYPRSIN